MISQRVLVRSWNNYIFRELEYLQRSQFPVPFCRSVTPLPINMAAVAGQNGTSNPPNPTSVPNSSKAPKLY